ncbi:SLBB domain-containing protein [Pacificimonas sp. WHA3]|uniref:SLBB domain-containing protein n=1 Tax=Pacificimonas pallii TaxID=2827236 RepID=A0ABS6SEY4_9SPHN|nr:SLBB domain-containing protein [Pacificimonas pallii]MBV7256896.1 SLBB domain-containing protein [Pacificimonas pallii]
MKLFGSRRQPFGVCALAAVLALTFASFITLPGYAQQPSAELIERLQRQAGGGLPKADPGEQLDRQREPDIREPSFSGGEPTLEELEVRRARSRQQLDALLPVSILEEEYRERLASETLRQFGYDLFQSAPGELTPITGEVGDSYVLGVGDELLVTFSGATSSSNTARVARDGRLIVASLPPLQAAGRTLGNVRRQIAGATRRNLLGTDVYVSLGGVRSITVLVGGEVARPGQYQVTSMADIASVIARAGGIRKSGTLRNVKLYRRGAARTVDLYGLLGIGTPSSAGVQDGDRIIVPVIGDTVAISGGVARPGIYEIRGNTTLGDVLAYAGGAVPPRGYRVSVSRIEDDGQENFVSLDGPNSRLRAGDGVLILGGSTGGKQNRVSLAGFVSNPGPRPLGAAGTVADLIGSSQELRLGTYLPMAVLRRRSLTSGLQEFEAVDLLSALDGTSPVPLRAEDRLIIFSRDDISFLNSTSVREILAGGQHAECPVLEDLRDLVSDTQSPRFNALLRNNFYSETSEVVATGQLLAGNDGALENMPEQDIESPCPEVFLENVELLTFVLEQSVSIGGSVRRPGAYPVANNESAATVIAAANGVLAAVRDGTIEVVRGDQFDRFALPAGGDVSGLANIIVGPGDELRVTAPLRNSEDGTVLLTGEFVSPGLYAIRPGERLSQLIARAGGYTQNAYPYGAVLTRQSVRDAQQAAQARTARQLRETVLALAARDEVDAEAVGAVSQIIDSMSKTDMPGRMVVEADPLALRARPDLDPLLEGGDALHVPNQPTAVYVFGSVLSPGALQFQAGKSVDEYVSEAGGTAGNTDKSRIFVVYPNGTAQPTRRSFWRRSDVVLPPGSTVIVPKDLTPLLGLEIAQTITGIFGGIAQAIATTLIVADRN